MYKKQRTSTLAKQVPTLVPISNQLSIKIPNFDCTPEELLQFIKKLYDECTIHYPALVARVDWNVISEQIVNINTAIWSQSTTGPKYMKEDKGRIITLSFWVAPYRFAASITLTLVEYYTIIFVMACIRPENTKGCSNKPKPNTPKTELSASDIQQRMDLALPRNLVKFFKLTPNKDHMCITDRKNYVLSTLLGWDVFEQLVLNEVELASYMKINKSKQSPKKDTKHKGSSKRRRLEEISSCSEAESVDESEPVSEVSVNARRVTRSTRSKQGTRCDEQIEPKQHDLSVWMNTIFPQLLATSPPHVVARIEAKFWEVKEIAQNNIDVKQRSQPNTETTPVLPAPLPLASPQQLQILPPPAIAAMPIDLATSLAEEASQSKDAPAMLLEGMQEILDTQGAFDFAWDVETDDWVDASSSPASVPFGTFPDDLSYDFETSDISDDHGGHMSSQLPAVEVNSF